MIRFLSKLSWLLLIGLPTVLPGLAGEQRYYFPQVALGAGATTSFMIHNPEAGEANVAISVHSSDGSVLYERQLSVPAGGMAQLDFADSEQKMRAGWAKLTSSTQIMVTELIGHKTSPAVGVLPALPLTHFKVFGSVGVADDLRTGLALANPGETKVDVTIALIDKEGNLVRRLELSLLPLAHRSG